MIQAIIGDYDELLTMAEREREKKKKETGVVWPRLKVFLLSKHYSRELGEEREEEEFAVKSCVSLQ